MSRDCFMSDCMQVGQHPQPQAARAPRPDQAPKGHQTQQRDVAGRLEVSGPGVFSDRRGRAGDERDAHRQGEEQVRVPQPDFVFPMFVPSLSW